MDVLGMINIQAVLFICMGVGFVAGKLKIVTETGRAEITDLIMLITLPASVIASFINTKFTPELRSQSISVLVVIAVVQACMVVFGNVFFPKSRFSEEDRKILKYSIINSNAAFVGIPVLTGLYGDLGALLTAVAMIPMRITLWTAGMSLFVAERDLKTKIRKIALHPSFVSVYIGILLMLLPVEYPAFMMKSLTTIGNSTTFLAMFMVGVIVSHMDFHGMLQPKVLYYCALRLVIFPLIVMCILKLLHFEAVSMTICVVLTAIPAGSYTALMAAKYNSNVPFASKIVLVSTLLSVVTMPLVCALI